MDDQLLNALSDLVGTVETNVGPCVMAVLVGGEGMIVDIASAASPLADTAHVLECVEGILATELKRVEQGRCACKVCKSELATIQACLTAFARHKHQGVLNG